MNSLMEMICSVCNNVRNNSKHGISFQKLLVRLRREFREQGFELLIKGVRDKKLTPEEFYVHAYYDPEDDQNHEIAIEVNVHHNFDKDTVWDQLHVTDFLIQIFDAVVHEFKHQRQSRKRKYIVYHNHISSSHDYHLYLADPDEVDAYALSIAIELCRTLGKFRALRYLSKFSSLCKLKFHGCYVSPQLAAYAGQFGNLNSPILKILAKKVYVRLQKVDTDCIFL